MNWLEEILSWPVELTALHGIAEIKTPLFKISTNAGIIGVKHSVRWLGQSFPVEGARGLVFPYRAPERLMISQSEGFKRGFSLMAQELVQIRPFELSNQKFEGTDLVRPSDLQNQKGERT